MEMHHRLRRDPNWHPSGCNICGQLGHQAAQCTTGTVNWRAMYGDNAFTIQRAVFQSELDALKKAKQIDFTDLEKRAKEYAKMRMENGGPPPQQAPPQRSQAQQHAQQPLHAQGGGGVPAGGAAPAPAAAAPPMDGAAKEEAERKKAAEDGLPEGWGVAFDAQKRPYYWHKTTKKVQWEKPTAGTPAS